MSRTLDMFGCISIVHNGVSRQFILGWQSGVSDEIGDFRRKSLDDKSECIYGTHLNE